MGSEGAALSAAVYGVALFDPAGEALVEDLHVAIAFLVEDAIGQTGQVVRASSIKDDRPVLRNLGQALRHVAQGDGDGARNVGLLVFFAAAHVDDERFLSRPNVIHELVQIDKLGRHALGQFLLGILRISAGVGDRRRCLKKTANEKSAAGEEGFCR